MANIVDYVQWKGDLSFADRPFNIIDNLVFAELSYLHLPKELAHRGSMTIRQLWDELGDKAVFKLLGPTDADLKLLEACASSTRFGDVELTDYEESDQEIEGTQFAAMTFRIDEYTSYVAFRGTDDSILGWKEDFMISYRKVSAQQRALEYLRRVLCADRSFYVGGHSKGANLALYAAAYLGEQLDHVDKIYLNDGPGFCADVLNADLIKTIDHKCVRITPEYCIVGDIFKPDITEDHIVRSDAHQIMQHAMTSWQVTPNGLETAREHDPISVRIGTLFDIFIEKMDVLDNRQSFVNSIFDTMSQNGAITIEDFVKEGPNAFENLIVKIADNRENGVNPLNNVRENIIADIKNSDFMQHHTLSEARRSDIRIGLSVIVAILCFVIPHSLIQTVLSLAIFVIIAYQISRTVLNLYRCKWDFSKEKIRVNTSIVLIVSYIVLIIKDDALTLLSSILFGIFFLVSSFQCFLRLRSCREKRFYKVRYTFELVMTLLLGGYLLLAPTVDLGWYMRSLGGFLVIDTVFEIIERCRR